LTISWNYNIITISKGTHKEREVIKMNNYEYGYECGREHFATIMDNFCLNAVQEYGEKADTHAKKDEMLNACFWQGAVFALRVVRKEIERLNE
jgi:hypothetical protein